MKILAIETATLLGGIALIDDARGLIAEVKMNVKTTHSERLMEAIDHAIGKASLRLDDIDAFAVSIGPCSFTGLRIGVSTAKGFSFATGKPIVSVPTLEAFAWNFPFCRYPVCTLLDARKREVYAAVFRWGAEGFTRLVAELSASIEKVMESIERSLGPRNEGVLFTGEGAILYREAIVMRAGDWALFPPPDKMVPSPANVATLGLRKALRGEFSEPIGLVPLYIRKSEAEIKKNG